MRRIRGVRLTARPPPIMATVRGLVDMAIDVSC
jgi:hypothetical protein